MDILDMGSLISHNDGHRNVFDEIDAFSNYVYSVPISFKWIKPSPSLRCILRGTGDSRLLTLRYDRVKEFETLSSARYQTAWESR
jgi:hypothetical protein